MSKKSNKKRMTRKERPDVVYIPPKDIPADIKAICKHNFDVIYADPAWSVNQRGNFGAIKHYDLMSTEEIKKMPVADFCKENAVCFLWIVGGPAGRKAGEEVMEAWGFKVVDEMIGVKLYMGLGNRTRHAYETCLIGERGKLPVDYKGQMNWIFFPKQDHSHKPEEMYAVIERLHRNKKYLELFARNRHNHPNWYIWGNEAEGGSDIYIPGYPVPEYSEKVKFVKRDSITAPDTLKEEGV